MIKEFRGSYSDEAFECYNLAESNVHIHSLSLYIDEESEDEVVAIGFSHYVDEIIGYVNPATKMVELYQVVMNGMQDDEGNPEVIEYGVAELGKLLAELDKMPHIRNVLEDRVGNERLH